MQTSICAKIPVQTLQWTIQLGIHRDSRGTFVHWNLREKRFRTLIPAHSGTRDPLLRPAAGSGAAACRTTQAWRQPVPAEPGLRRAGSDFLPTHSSVVMFPRARLIPPCHVLSGKREDLGRPARTPAMPPRPGGIRRPPGGVAHSPSSCGSSRLKGWRKVLKGLVKGVSPSLLRHASPLKSF